MSRPGDQLPPQPLQRLLQQQLDLLLVDQWKEHEHGGHGTIADGDDGVVGDDVVLVVAVADVPADGLPVVAAAADALPVAVVWAWMTGPLLGQYQSGNRTLHSPPRQRGRLVSATSFVGSVQCVSMNGTSFP